MRFLSLFKFIYLSFKFIFSFRSAEPKSRAHWSWYLIFFVLVAQTVNNVENLC